MSSPLSHLATKALNQLAGSQFHAFQALMHPIVSAEPYVDAMHLRAIAWKLQQVAEGKNKRLLGAVPPRHFKSFQASVALPAFLLGLNPAMKVICVSYGAELSENFAKQSRDILRSPRYGAIFPGTQLRSANPPVHDIRTTKGGYRYTTSTGGALTGLGADVLILDDPIKAAEASSQIVRDSAHEWLKASAMSRFDKPGEGAVIVLMQRLHQDDVIGRLVGEGGWDLLELPAIAPASLSIQTGRDTVVDLAAGGILFPARFDHKILADRQREMGDVAYHAQYLQRPTPPGGHLFKMDRFRRFDLETNRDASQYEQVILSLDPGVSSDLKADHSALTIWGVRGPQLYLTAVRRGQWTFGQQLEQLRYWRPKVNAMIIERSHSGILLMDTLRAETGSDDKLIGYSPKLEKLVRAEQAALLVEQGRVFLPHAAPWLAAYEQEMAAFPHGTHDDQVDSTSQLAFNLWRGLPGWVKLSAYPPRGLVRIAGSAA